MEPRSWATQEKTSEANGRSSVATRLIVCVDGTWGEPDGTHNAYQGNISKIYRVFLATQEGAVVDEHGKTWEQKRKYFKGINNPDKWLG